MSKPATDFNAIDPNAIDPNAMEPNAIDSNPYQPATQFLSQVDTDWSRLIEIVGPCTFTPHPAREPYEALVHAVAHQQLHAKAADAILGRFKALYGGFPAPEQLLASTFEDLRACGFSGSKIASIQGIAQGTLDGVVPTLDAASGMSNEELVKQLVSLKGIGQWTVEMFLMFTLERMDILPVDDFAVREGYKRLKSLEAAPSPKQLRTLGEAWSPYRSIAAWYLWRVPRDEWLA